MLAYEQGDYTKAEQSLRIALEDASKLKEKNVSKAWYYLGISLIGIERKATQEKDVETLQEYEGALLESYHCFRRAIKNDTETKRYDKLAKTQLTSLSNGILNRGIQSLNTGGYNEAMLYMNAAVGISENTLEEKNYLAYDLRAQTLFRYNGLYQCSSRFYYGN